MKKLAIERNVTLVLPSVPTSGACETGKAQYLEEQMTEIEEIKTIKLQEIEYEGKHPSKAGTVKIIETINKYFADEIILDGAKDDITTKRKYSQVQPIYKAGCRGCDSTQYTPDLCSDCVRIAKTFNTEYLQQIIDRIHDKQYPEFEFQSDENEIEIREITKRSRQTSESDDKSSKNARNESA